jgi:predicted ATPase
MILESQLNLKLIEPLDEAVQRGLVNSLNGMYHFSHDRIQEASYRLIEERFRVANHLTYGQCLVKCALENEDDDLFFIAVNHINLGSSAVTNGNALHAFVSYNLSAGKKSIVVANISAANAFFCSGISFLPDNHWRDTQYYHLSLEIFELAAKTSLAMGDVQRFHVFSNQVTSNARCFEDKLNVFYIVLLSLIFASKISDAIEQGVDIVRRLGEEIPHNLSKEVLDQQMRDTQALLRGLSKDDILNYPLMQDTKKIMAMKFIGRLQYVAFFAKPALHQYFVLKIVQLTLTHGKSIPTHCFLVTDFLLNNIH